MVSVVIRGVPPCTSVEEVEAVLRTEGHTISKCLRIITEHGTPSYIIRVLTSHQLTIDELLRHGAYIYKRRHRVEPSRTQPPIPLRCETCRTYGEHTASECTNHPICGYCSEPYPTKNCTNLQNSPKCNQCQQQHPTYSYKGQVKPTSTAENNLAAIPLRTPEPDRAVSNNNATPAPNIEQIIQFITLTFQNLYPRNRNSVIHKVKLAALDIFKEHVHATYSGPYVFFTISPASPT